MDPFDWNFPSDEEIADSRGSRGDQSRVFINTLKADTPQVFYFITMPGSDPRDWVNYRELNTREGLRVGPELPNDLSYGVMVHDYRMVDNPITGRRSMEIDNNLDPLTAGEPHKQMWQEGSKNVDKNGLIRVQWRCGVNVVDAITGYHKILKISLTAKEDLVKYFATAFTITEEQGGTFNVRGRPYEILYTGQGFNWNVAIRTVRPGSSVIRDGEAVEVPKLADLPEEPIDVRQVMREQREEMDAWLASLPTRSGKAVDTTISDWDTSMEGAPEFVSSGMDVFAGGNIPANGADPDLTEKYLAMSPARLRALLSKADIDVPRGTTKNQLAAWAAERLG